MKLLALRLTAAAAVFAVAVAVLLGSALPAARSESSTTTTELREILSARVRADLHAKEARNKDACCKSDCNSCKDDNMKAAKKYCVRFFLPSRA